MPVAVTGLRIARILGFSFATTLSANIMNPGLFGSKILHFAPPSMQNTFLGWLTFLWSTITIFNLPIVGAFSDRTRSKYGSRMPFFVLGAFGMSVAAIGVAVSPTISILVFCLVFLSLFDDTIIAPWLAFFRETVPESRRGELAGYKALVDIVAVIMGRQAAGLILSLEFMKPQHRELLLGLLITVALLVSLWAVPRDKTADPLPLKPKDSPASATSIFKVDWLGNQSFAWWFANRFLFWMGFIILGTFSLFYALDVLNLSEPEAQRFVGNLTSVIGAAILIIAIPGGKLADRYDRRAVIFWACISAAVGTALLVSIEGIAALWMAALLVGGGAGIYMSANLALLTDLVPPDEIGRFMGLGGVASAAGGALARLLGGTLIDAVNWLTNSSSAGYIVVFLLTALFFAASGFFILAIPKSVDRTKELFSKR